VVGGFVRVRMPDTPPYAMFIGRTPPPVNTRRKSVELIQLDIPAASHPNPERDLVQKLAYLPMSEQAAPELLPSGSTGRLLGPWRQHPTLPLLLSAAALTEVHSLLSWPGLGVHLSPTVIGLPFKPETSTAVALRAFGAVRNRERLVEWLTDLALISEAREMDREFEFGFIEAMRLPLEVDARLHAELTSRRTLLQTACIWWLLAEALHAPPAPFGTPPLDAAGRQLQSLFIPSLDVGAEPTEAELCRAVLLAQEGFLVGEPGSSPKPAWILDTMSALAFQRSGIGQPMDRLIRAFTMWLVSDEARCAAHMSAPPSTLRADFARIAGIPPETLMIHGAHLCATSRATLLGHEELGQSLSGLLDPSPHRENAVRFLSVLSQRLAATPTTLQKALRDEHRGSTRRWGSLPHTPSMALLSSPLIQTRERLTPWSLSVFAAAVIDLPREILHEAGHDRRRVGGDIGRLFEGYLEERLSALDSNRHRWIHDDHMGVAIDGRKPDFVIAHGPDAVVVEASASRLDLEAVTGREGAHVDTLSLYRKKLAQASTIVNDLSAAGRLFGLSRLRSAYPVLVLNDPLVFTPRVASLVLGEAPPYVCGVEEFDWLIDLESAGWSVPSLIERWQTVDTHMLLGHSLQRASSIRRDPGLAAGRVATAMARYFRREPAEVPQ